MNEQTDQRDEHIGQTLKRLRGDTSIRAVQRASGISNAYLSQIEKGNRHPGPKGLRRLAPLYGVDIRGLVRRAGYLDREGRGARDGRGHRGAARLPVRSASLYRNLARWYPYHTNITATTNLLNVAHEGCDNSVPMRYITLAYSVVPITNKAIPRNLSTLFLRMITIALSFIYGRSRLAMFQRTVNLEHD